MARRGKSNIGMYVAIGVGGFAVIVLLDHYVLRGSLGISGYFNMLLGKLKQIGGVGAGPITPAAGKPATDPNLDTEAALQQAEQREQELAMMEPETL